MAVDGFTSAGSGVEHTGSSTGHRAKHSMVTTARMMVATATVMASVLVVVMVMVLMGTMNSSGNVAAARTNTCAGVGGSPLGAAVRIVEQ